MRKTFIVCFLILWMSESFAQQKSPLYIDQKQKAWVDSVYNSLSLSEKVGQLFMVAAYSNKGITHEKKIEDLIKKENIGGVIFMQDDALHQVELVNHYQRISKVPLLIGMDAEWDVSMRLKNTNKFPWAMTLGALKDNHLIYKMSQKIAEHLKTVGAHFNFAPDTDVNVNSNNPIIGNRSFGSNPCRVAEKGIAYMKGLQNNHILASAKHFPGHGDTSQDSHKTLPTIHHSKQRLNKIELVPFKELIKNGVTAIMVAHLNVPAYEKDPKKPASLSKNIVTHLLKEELGFKGLIITDALNMNAVTKNYPNGLSDYIAFTAGNDVLLFSQAVNKGKNKIINAIKSGKIKMSRLEESVKKILMAKYYVGLNKPSLLSQKRLAKKLNDSESKQITFDIFQKAITLLKNHNNYLPIKDFKSQKFAWLPLGNGDKSILRKSFQKYTKIDEIQLYTKGLNKYNTIFISIHEQGNTPYESNKISKEYKQKIKQISEQTNVVLIIFKSPYVLKEIDTNRIESIIIAYQNHKDAQKIVPQFIFAPSVNSNFEGRLPVDVSVYKEGDYCSDLFSQE